MLDDINIIDIRKFPGRHTQNAVSPFRYPGGKGFLSGFLTSHIAHHLPQKQVIFVEPFCGGAGAALNLLADGLVSEIHLNDVDTRIYSAWRAMVSEPDRFIEAVKTVRLDMGSVAQIS